MRIDQRFGGPRQNGRQQQGNEKSGGGRNRIRTVHGVKGKDGRSAPEGRPEGSRRPRKTMPAISPARTLANHEKHLKSICPRRNAACRPSGRE
ncbi:hypothetical protein [Caballeronia sp. ATUFL_M2_KS44]|uniref:hypothetical protein n=1 Tax=Caballeronia sp. ATUFL_M2_KS44 TaxID=2921767 RepID=UPI002027B7B4|nr:hypothetical protein [Caballeronia sp. ATUFL_M2_KS44]